MKTIARLPIDENLGYHIYQPIKYVVGELIIKEDENGHFHSIATYFDEKVEKKEYMKATSYKSNSVPSLGGEKFERKK